MDAAGLGSVAIAVTFVGSVAVETVLAPVLGRLTDRQGRLAPLWVCLPLSVVVLVALGWASAPELLILLVVACGLAVGPIWTPGTALFSDGASDAGVDHVVSFSLSNVVWALGGLGGAYGAGVLAELGSEPVPYSLLAAAAAATFVWLRSQSHEETEASGLGSTRPAN
jgi:MFS family permease